MASEMVERVARALDAILGDDHESLSMEMGCGSIGAKLRKEAMEKGARAAIEAMREPTEAMVAHADDQMPSEGIADGGGIETRHRDAEDIWSAMIDAALKP